MYFKIKFYMPEEESRRTGYEVDGLRSRSIGRGIIPDVFSSRRLRGYRVLAARYDRRVRTGSGGTLSLLFDSVNTYSINLPAIVLPHKGCWIFINIFFLIIEKRRNLQIVVRNFV